MVKYLIIILILVTLAHQQQAGDVKKQLAKAALKRAAHKAIQALISYSTFLKSPQIILDLFEVVTGFEPSNVKENTEMNSKIIESLNVIDSKVDVLSQNMLNFEKEIMRKTDTNEQHRDLKNALNKFYHQVNIINFLYGDYLKMMNDSLTFSNYTYNSLINTLQSYYPNGIRFTLNELHNSLTENLVTYRNIPMYYADVYDLSRLLMCQSKQSAQRLIFNFYELITVTEMKGALMMTFAYQDLLKPNETWDDLRDFTNQQKERLKKTLLTIKPIAARAPREMWVCDPQHHVIGTTCEHVGPVFQKFVMFKGDVVQIPGTGTDVAIDESQKHQLFSHPLFKLLPFWIIKNICDQNTCASIKREKPKYCYSYRTDNICNHEPIEKFTCKTSSGVGDAVDCKPTEKELNICLAKKNDHRRYKTIAAGNKVYGNKESCTSTVHQAISKKELFFYDCDYCLCTCVQDHHPQAKTSVSLKSVVSDVNKNKIITGVRILHVNGLFQILIEQSKLQANGLIDRSSTAWKKPHIGGQNAEDHVKITWDHRTFLLDDLEGPEGHVLTGIRFKTDGNSDIKLAIQTMPFNLTSGKLQIDERLWLNNPNSTAHRKELKLAKYEVPTLYHKHEHDSDSNQFIQLTTSDMEQDVGQTVVPFFDIQPVNSTYPMPLSGAGFIHKGYRNSAGFLALKVTTFDIDRLIPKKSDLYH